MTVMTLLQWAAAKGRVTTADVDAHLHAGLRSKPRWKSYDRWFAQRLRELQDARDATTRDYEAACERGEVRPPTYAERLRQTTGRFVPREDRVCKCGAVFGAHDHSAPHARGDEYADTRALPECLRFRWNKKATPEEVAIAKASLAY